MNLRPLLFAAVGAALLAGCKKEFDTPPVRNVPVGAALTVAQLRAQLPPGAPSRKFVGDSSVYAVVTADEQNGNLYKNVYVQDHTGAIQLRLLNSGGLYQGDSIRIYLRGTRLSLYQGMMQLDSVDVDNNIIKQATGIQKVPQDVTIDQVTPAMQGKLVRVTGVEFALSEIGQTYADAVNQVTVNRLLSDCNTELIVRTSGYANFANQQLPTGKGSIVGVVGQFGTTNPDMQLFIRNINEVQLNGTDRCDPLPTLCAPAASVQQDFATTTSNVDISNLACWNNAPQVGTRRWRGRDVSGNLCASASAVGSSAASDVQWLITPPVTVTPSTTLSFRSQRQFDAPGHTAPLAVFISTNYTISNLSNATWIPVPAPIASELTADGAWIASGAIGIASLLPPGYNGGFVVGFRYTGSGPNGQTMRINIDDVVIQ